jgi:ferredoxin
MADPKHKVPENAPGPYYVDDTCIDCDLCRSLAPHIFVRDDVNAYTYVHHQPATPGVMAQADEARSTDTIGNDG